MKHSKIYLGHILVALQYFVVAKNVSKVQKNNFSIHKFVLYDYKRPRELRVCLYGNG